jgi:DNA (cytosine-5)-methyltransferase 1
MKGPAVGRPVRPTAVDLFSGAGGFSRGFTEAGFEVTHAVELQKPHAAAYQRNFPHVQMRNEDIRQVAGFGTRPDVLLGGPPCEAFTGANARRERDPLQRLYGHADGALVLEFVRVAEMLKPRVLVMENVVGVAEGPLRDALRTEFRRAGYPTLFFNVLRAEEHGTPSRRERLFVSNLPLEPTSQAGPILVRDALAGLPPPGPSPANHEPTHLSPEKERKVARLRRGDALVRFRSAGGRGLANWMRLYPDQLAPPVMGRSRFVHPDEPRILTVREQARLMGYPDAHVFEGGKESQYEQVGESVPPPLAQALAGEVLRYLQAVAR